LKIKIAILKKRIAIFASGSGSNAQKIMEHFKKSEDAEVSIATHIFDRKEFRETNNIIDILKNLNIDLIVLAGFLWLVPKNLLEAFPNKIINIHPALLPKYGGKGMYGDFVHNAVLANKETESGITIHFVNEHFDEGEVIYRSAIRASTFPKSSRKHHQKDTLKN
jgi:phosphoribosylglycinamide formyltransferase-1